MVHSGALQIVVKISQESLEPHERAYPIGAPFHTSHSIIMKQKSPLFSTKEIPENARFNALSSQRPLPHLASY